MTSKKLVGVVVCTVALLAVACLNASAMMAHFFRASQPANPGASSPIKLKMSGKVEDAKVQFELLALDTAQALDTARTRAFIDLAQALHPVRTLLLNH
jgi:hypothetical protein